MRSVFALLLTAVCSACGSSEAPTPAASIVFGQPSPSAGSVIRPTMTISGFQVGRMPCHVTGIRAMLHTRNSGLLTPPTASETIAEATRTIAYSLQ